jgi:hypothetical protein
MIYPYSGFFPVLLKKIIRLNSYAQQQICFARSIEILQRVRAEPKSHER